MVQKSSEAIIAIISQLPGAIGYVEAGKVSDAVKILPVK
jgi:ABC-type phosphate transport system substrate-binding protein